MLPRITIVCGLLAVIAGCAQQTEAPVEQQTQQAQVTPTATEQRTGTLGSTVTVYVLNAPGKSGMPAEIGSGVLDQIEVGPLAMAEGSEDAGERTYGMFTQKDVNITITTGGTTPTVSGTTTGTATATQTPSAYPTQTPTLEAKPAVSGSVGIAAPGGVASPQATATGEGQTSGVSQSVTAETRTLLQDIRAEQSVIKSILESLKPMLESISSFFAPATQPAAESAAEARPVQ